MNPLCLPKAAQEPKAKQAKLNLRLNRWQRRKRSKNAFMLQFGNAEPGQPTIEMHCQKGLYSRANFSFHRLLGFPPDVVVPQ